MLQELISTHSEIFSDTRRFQHVPDNWDAVKWMLAELFMISANASRTRQLQRINANYNAYVNPSTDSTSPGIAEVAITRELQQAWPNGLNLLLTNRMILDHVVVPVVYGDLRIDILPDEFRKSDNADEPQSVRDISLHKLVSVLRQKFQTDNALQVLGMNSMGSFIELEDDRQLEIALILFVQLAWPYREKPPCLQVRPARQSASP